MKGTAGAGLLTSHGAAEVFEDNRPGVVLTVEAAGPLWIKDSWVRKRAGGLS
jgi:hypothetical protein